jgi:catechol 2,3-dioxygenase-like lactoylglutathione lyase family enzyme
MTGTTSPITGVDFVSVPTRDLEAAMEFYGDVLGLPRSSVWQRPGHDPVGAEFETGTVTIALLYTEGMGMEYATCPSPRSVPSSRRRSGDGRRTDRAPVPGGRGGRSCGGLRRAQPPHPRLDDALEHLQLSGKGSGAGGGDPVGPAAVIARQCLDQVYRLLSG